MAKLDSKYQPDVFPNILIYLFYPQSADHGLLK